MTDKIFKTIEEAEEFCRENFDWDESEVVLGRYWVVKGFIEEVDGSYVVVSPSQDDL